MRNNYVEKDFELIDTGYIIAIDGSKKLAEIYSFELGLVALNKNMLGVFVSQINLMKDSEIKEKFNFYDQYFSGSNKIAYIQNNFTGPPMVIFSM